MSLKLTVIDHQDQHHGSRGGKSKWNAPRSVIDKLLIAFVSAKEKELRMAKAAAQHVNVFYIVDTFLENETLFSKETYPKTADGLCVEVVISEYTDIEIIADIHGYPVSVIKPGVSSAMKNLCDKTRCVG